MKNFPLGILLFVFALGVSTFISCTKSKDEDNDDNNNQPEKGVVIYDLIWATRNVSEPGKFVAKSEGYGGYFTFEEAKTACPEGWRLPTVPEFSSISGHNEWTTLNGVTGSRFSNLRDENTIFLSAAGRLNSQGNVNEQGTEGWYWSATGLYGYRLFFDEDHAGLGSSNETIYGFSVRCVKDLE